VRRPVGRRSRNAGWRTVAATLAIGAMVAGWGADLVPVSVVAAYGVLSLAGFALYLHDKRAARSGAMRTRERTLHVVDLLGGWPGGLLAQDRFRHKTGKASFQVMFWTTVAVNCAVLGWLLRSGYLA